MTLKLPLSLKETYWILFVKWHTCHFLHITIIIYYYTIYIHIVLFHLVLISKILLQEHAER